MKKALKADIPLKERDQWEAWHADNRAEHARLTAAIVAHGTDLDARVYALFGPTAEEIALVEASTK